MVEKRQFKNARLATLIDSPMHFVHVHVNNIFRGRRRCVGE